MATTLSSAVRKELVKLALDPDVEDYITAVSTCVLEEGGKARQLKTIIGPIIEEFVPSDDDLCESPRLHGFQLLLRSSPCERSLPSPFF